MKIPKGFLKFCGFMLLIGGIMGFTGQLFHLSDVPDSLEHIPVFLESAVNIHVLLAYASTFVLLGLPAMYLLQSEKLKWWGWLSYPFLFIALMFEIFHGPVQIVGYPLLFGDITTEAELQRVSDMIINMDISSYPLMMAVFAPILPFLVLGIVLFGIATIKAKVFPKSMGIYPIIALALLIAGLVIPIHLRVLEIAFAYIHLTFVIFGAYIAFKKTKEVSVEEKEDVKVLNA